LSEPSFAEDLAINGLATIRLQHTCAHRVDELLDVYAELAKETKQLEIESSSFSLLSDYQRQAKA
jgi:spore maturation protein CgeB